MKQIKHPAGEWTKPCIVCKETMTFKHHCHWKVRKFCSFECRGIYVKRRPVKNQYGKFAPWTKEERAELRRVYNTFISNKDLGDKFGRSYHVVHIKAKQMGLIRSDEVLSECYAQGGKMNKGRPRPDLAKNDFVGKGKDNPFYGKKHSDATKKTISEHQKKLNTFGRLANDPIFQKKRMQSLQACPNKPETTIMGLLDEMYPGEYRFTGNGDLFIDRLNPDFASVEGKKLIEVFGEPFHDPDQSPYSIGPRSTEDGRRKVFAKNGYEVLIIWSKEITRGGLEGRKALRRKIVRFYENSSY